MRQFRYTRQVSVLPDFRLNLATQTATRQESPIDVLYRELDQLMTRAETGDQTLQPEIEDRLARLRALQEAEARRMRQYFESRLNLAPGAGLRALQDAKRLLADDETPASTDTPPHGHA